MNVKIATLLLGLLVGGLAGYFTRPQTAELKVGSFSVEVSNDQIKAGSDAGLTSGQMQHVLLFALAGGVAGLLLGLVLGRRV